MLLLRLFLLVMLIGQLESAERKVSNCDGAKSMTCFVPLVCKPPPITGDPESLVLIDSNQKVIETCEAIVKIRLYTSKYAFIVLESYRDEIESLELKQGNTKIECKRNGDKVTTWYNNNEDSTKLIKHQSSPLSCEFTVKDENNDIFDVSLTVIAELSSSAQKTYICAARNFNSKFNPTCNPENVTPGKVGLDGDNIISPVEGNLADLNCPIGNKLKYRENSASIFTEASKISCVEQTVEIGYSPIPLPPATTTSQLFVSTFEAHCEVPICTLCEKAQRSDPNLKYESEAGCNKLKCKEGRIKIGSSEPVDGSAECKYVDDKPVWQVKDGTIITDHAAVTCSKKLNCDIADAKRLCGPELGKTCILDIHNLPICIGKRNATFNDVEGDVQCNEDTGKHYFRMGANKVHTEGLTIKCVGPPEPANPQASKGGLDTGATVGICAVILIVVGSVGAYVAFRFYSNKKKQKAPNDVTVEKQAQSKSKESSKSLASLQSKKAEGTVKEMPKMEEPKIEVAKAEEKAVANSQKSSNDVVKTPGGHVTPCKIEYMSDHEKLPTPAPPPEVSKPTPKNEESVRRKSKNAKKGVPSDTSESKKKEEVSDGVTGGTVVGADGQRIPEAQIGPNTNDATGVTGVTGKSGKTLTHGGKVSPSGEFIRRADADKR